MEPSIFTKIIVGEIPAHKIYEDDSVIAILTINPVTEGHVLVIPKKQVDQVWDLEPSDYEDLWQKVQIIARRIRDVYRCDRVGVTVKGFEVAHTHIHLMPINKGSNISLDPEPAPGRVSDEVLAGVAEKLRFS